MIYICRLYKILYTDVNALTNNILDDGCSSTISAATTGKTLLMRGCFDACSWKQRCENAHTAGFSRCMLYACNSNAFYQIISDPGSSSIPSLFTLESVGSDILANPSVVVSVPGAAQKYLVPTAGTVSPFSSGGLTPELFINPDLGGVGGNVFSTISPFAQSSQGLSFPYRFYSGTSQATPYVAGCIALLIQGLKKREETVTLNNLKAYMKNTATVSSRFATSKIESIALQVLHLLTF